MLNTAVPEGGFGKVREIKGSPVPSDTVLENIRQSASVNLPILTRQKDRDGALIFVAGGPTLRQFLGEIKARKEAGEYICTSNNTHDYLIDNGIIPDACLLFDPKKRVADYIKKPQVNTLYYLGVTVHIDVFKALEKANCQKVLIAYGLDDDADLMLQKTLYPTISLTSYLVGGTMTPLRAMPLAGLLGFRKIEYYGMDSCFAEDVPALVMEDDPRYKKALVKVGRGYEDTETGKSYVIDEPDDGGYFYAYKKDRTEDVIVAECGERRFVTSPGFAWQAKQLVEWANRLEGRLEVIVHGDSLSSHMLALSRAEREGARQTIGDARWTPAYAALQVQMREAPNYGVGDWKHFEPVARMCIGIYAQLHRKIRLLDYGCGHGKLKAQLENALECVEVTNYDPFDERWDEEPDEHDIVACMDVLEHVEEQCVDNVLKHIASKAKYGTVFFVGLHPAAKELPDGRNAHITLKHQEWWRQQVEKHLHVTEMMPYTRGVMIIASAKESLYRAEQELKQRAA